MKRQYRLDKNKVKEIRPEELDTMVTWIGVPCADCGVIVQRPNDWPVGKPAYCTTHYDLRIAAIEGTNA
jgi:hypothetical protein